MKKIVQTIISAIKKVLLIYAIIFSIAGSICIGVIGYFVYKPVNDVRELVRKNPKESRYMAHIRRNLVAAGQADTLQHHFVPLDSISKNLKNAVLAAEDDGFYTHPGFNLKAMLEAYDYNQEHKSFRRGASTITQQLAKNLFLNGDKLYARKAVELVYALLMEHYLGKDRILELYLNYVQFGKTIFGCEEASRVYFGKPSLKLSMHESAALAAVLMSPNKYSPLNTGSGYIQRRMSAIANNLYLRRQIDDSTLRLLGGTPAVDSVRSDSVAIEGDEQAF